MTDTTSAARCPLCGNPVPVLDKHDLHNGVRCARCVRESIEGGPTGTVPPRREPA
jgi:hypothetical protein